MLSLAVGFVTAMLVALFVLDELSYDRFLPEHDRIHRVSIAFGTSQADVSHPDFARLLKPNFRSIEHIARLAPIELGVRRGETNAREGMFAADPDFFSVLPFRAIAGDPSRAMQQPDKIVITRKIARKYFGHVDVVGQPLEIDRKHTMHVGAVLEDLPSNSHMNLDIVVPAEAPFSPLPTIDSRPVGSTAKPMGLYTYLRLTRGASAQELQAQLPSFIDRHMSTPTGKKPSSVLQISVVPVSAIHLRPAGIGAMKPSGSMTTIVAFSGIALLIAVAAASNFVNLATARASRRATEIGIRKANGATPGDLFVQFVAESIGHALLALLIAMAIVEVALPQLDAYLQRSSIVTTWHDPKILGAFVAAAMLIGGLAGIYPAVVLAGFRPAMVLRTGRSPTAERPLVRKGLVIVQFAISIGLIASTLIVHRQASFAMNEGARLDGRDIVMISASCTDELKRAIGQLPGVVATGCTQQLPLFIGSAANVPLPDGKEVRLFYSSVDPDFFPLYGLRPLAGRLFDAHREADRAPSADADLARTREMIVINETAVAALGLGSSQEAIGQTIRWLHMRATGVSKDKITSEVIGVIPDFVVGSVRDPIPPIALLWDPVQLPSLHARLASDSRAEALRAIDRAWSKFYATRPLQRTFLSDARENMYFAITRQSQLLGGFAAISVLLGSLGILGFATITVDRRTKEIGVRRAFGAGRRDVLVLLAGQLATPVLWASVIAIPAAAFVMSRWLKGFAYHIDLAIWMLMAGSVGAFVIAAVVVMAQTLRATRIRPSSALRYE